MGDRRRQEGARDRAPRRASRASCSRASTSSPTAGARRRSAACSAGGSARRHRRRADRPRDPRVLLRRRRARARGLRHDRDLDRGDDLDAGRLQVRHRRPALPGLRGEDRRRRRDPDQGPEHLPGLLQERGGDVGDDRRRLAAHRRHRRDRRGRLPLRSPAARRTSSSPPGGKNITPANLETDIKQTRCVSQCVVVGDRRPYLVALVTLDPEEAAAYAAEHGLPEDPAALAANAEVQRARSRPTSSRSTRSSPASSRSRSSRSSPTTSPRRPAS